MKENGRGSDQERRVNLRDPEMQRLAMRSYIDDILSHPDFKQPINTSQLSRVYPRLRQTVIDPLLDQGMIPYISTGERRYGPGSGISHRALLDPIGISIALFLVDTRKTLGKMDKRHAKELEEIATEEYEALLAEEKKQKAEQQRSRQTEVFHTSKKKRSRARK